MKIPYLTLVALSTAILSGCAVAETTSPSGGPAAQTTVLFQDSMMDNWRQQWFLDGEKATVEHRPEGLFFSGGTVTKEDDPVAYNAHHAVLWTKDSFAGDIRISYQMTRVDESDYGNTLLYIQAQGIGLPQYSKDIADRKDARRIPMMSTYFTYMDLISVSFRKDIRIKRYPYSNQDGERLDSRGIIPPRPDYIGMIPGKTYQVIADKKADTLRLQLRDAETNEEYLDQTWDITQVDPSVEPKTIREGRVGLRHMSTKQFIYKDFKVERL